MCGTGREKRSQVADQSDDLMGVGIGAWRSGQNSSSAETAEMGEAPHAITSNPWTAEADGGQGSDKATELLEGGGDKNVREIIARLVQQVPIAQHVSICVYKQKHGSE